MTGKGGKGLLIKATIAGGGVIPHIHKNLLIGQNGEKLEWFLVTFEFLFCLFRL